MIDYTTQRDKFVEDSIKENLDICVTPKMKELLNINNVLYDLMRSLDDEKLIRKISDFHMNTVFSELSDEIRNNSFLNTF